jgi:hypothetical protein
MSAHNRHPEWRHLLLVAGVIFAVVWTVAAAAALASEPTKRIPARVTFMTAATRSHASDALGRGTILGGFTSQGWPIVIKLSSDHRRIARVGIGLDMRCASGSQFALRDGAGPVPIGAGRKVHMAATISPTSGSSVSIVGGSDVFAGTLAPGRTAFSGVWDLRLAFATADGHTDTCDSGRVTFAATV